MKKILFTTLLLIGLTSCSKKKETIKVGLLHSLSGTMSISEVDIKNAEMLAIEEINNKGGILGKKIEPIAEDGASDWPTFAEKSKKLIQQDEVDAVFGCWTSASRKAVLPVFEQFDHLLFYPVQYEGLESSKNIVYTGACPNQQSTPAVQWLIDQGYKKFFLLGSDYVYPRTANKTIKKHLESKGVEYVAEEYVPLGGIDFATIVQKIISSGADVVVSTVNGDSNVAFFKQLISQGVTPDKVPTMSFSIAEVEVKSIGAELMKGQYTAWNYYMTMESAKNDKFVAAYKAKYGADKVTDDPIEAAYFGVHLWAKAVKKAGSSDPKEVRKVISQVSYDAPEGIVQIDAKNNHTVKNFMIGRVNQEGLFDIVFKSDQMITPNPYQ